MPEKKQRIWEGVKQDGDTRYDVYRIDKDGGECWWEVEKAPAGDWNDRELRCYSVHIERCSLCGIVRLRCSCDHSFWRGTCKHIEMVEAVSGKAKDLLNG